MDEDKFATIIAAGIVTTAAACVLALIVAVTIKIVGLLI